MDPESRLLDGFRMTELISYFGLHITNNYMKYFIANWKSHKTIAEGKAWLTTFQDLLQKNDGIQQKLHQNEIAIIICPPFHLLYPMYETLTTYPNYSLGAQNISPYPEGSYTGEVAARLIKDLVRYTLVGHSERRKYFHERDSDVEMKVQTATTQQITPIVCIRSQNDLIPNGVSQVAYEPVDAIGTGNIAPLDDVLAMKKKLMLNPGTQFIYGGSVDLENGKEYIQTEGIDGLLIGTASLDPEVFFSIINKR